MRTIVVAGLLVSAGACSVESHGTGTFDPGITGGDSSPEDDDGTGDGDDESSDAGDSSGTMDEPSDETGETGGTDETGETGALDCPTLGAWVGSAPFVDGDGHSHPLPSFAVGDFYYVHTITGGERLLLSSTPQPDGSLGPWQLASSDHGGGPHGFTAVAVEDTAYHFRNGHIAEYPLDLSGTMQGDVVLLEDDVDDAFGGDKFVWDSALLLAFEDARWVFHLGGFSFGPYDYRRAVRRNALPLGPEFAEVGVEHPADRPGKAAAYVPPGADQGFVFSGEASGRRLWRATVHLDGTMTGWEALPDRPDGTGNERGDLFVAGRALFAVQGSLVFRALVDDEGQLGAWTPMPSLPEDQIDVHWGDGHLEGAAWGRIGDTVYLTGPRSVFAAPLEPGACDEG